MFTGIIETLGEVKDVKAEGSNHHIRISSTITTELQIDQSVSHNGVCLTVVEIDQDEYVVTAIKETLDRSNLGSLSAGDLINLERCVRLDSRLDGHIVQGHVDATGICTAVHEENGSWTYRFEHEPQHAKLIIPKGSVAINGVSLTVVDPGSSDFGVAIIPYTYEHTNFHQIKTGDSVNLEFDILGKYILRNLALQGSSQG
ncbi:MAG: riboflavin synthase [Bacteroidota bacterium]